MENQNSSKVRAKRPFSQVDKEEDEAVPISKRINHLNIKGPRTSNDQDDQPPVPQPEVGAVGGAMTHQPLMRVPLMAAPFDRSPPPPPPLQAMDPTFQAAQHWDCAGRPVAMPHHNHHHHQTSSPINHQMGPASSPPMMNGGHCTAGPGLEDPSVFYHQSVPPVTYPSMAQHPSPGANNGAVQHGLQFQHSGSPGDDGRENVYDDDVVMMDDEVYDPELGETENPHYFQINHVLFQAQCQRARRNGYTLNSGPPHQ